MPSSPNASAAYLDELLRHLQGVRALVLGDAMLDVYLRGETVRISREAPVPVVRKTGVETRLGGAANTAANLRALGADVRLITVVGDDDSADDLRRQLADAGVELLATVDAHRQTPTKTRVLAGAVGTTLQQVLRIDDEPTTELGEGAAAKLVASFEASLSTSQVVLVSDYGLKTVGTALREAVVQAAKGGMLVCVDSRHALGDYRGVGVVTPNLPEAEAFLARALRHPQEIEQGGQELVRTLGVQCCLLTQGRGGMSLFRPEVAPAHVGILGEEEVTDVTGAGDTVAATFALGLAAGIGMTNAMHLSNMAAALVVQRRGTATASPAQLRDLAERYPIPWEDLA